MAAGAQATLADHLNDRIRHDSPLSSEFLITKCAPRKPAFVNSTTSFFTTFNNVYHDGIRDLFTDATEGKRRAPSGVVASSLRWHVTQRLKRINTQKPSHVQ